MSLLRNATGREFQRHGPAMEKLLSPRRVRVLFVAHVKYLQHAACPVPANGSVQRCAPVQPEMDLLSLQLQLCSHLSLGVAG